jgi:aminopeptidase N
MEHQTMSSVVNFNRDLLAHELAHQWFGDKVTCGTWTDIWLNEGFATYLNGLMYDFLDSEDEWDKWVKATMTAAMQQPGGSVFCSDTTSENRIFSSQLSYAKGAMLLHMLRWKLGDSAFFSGVRNYVTDPELAYGFARTINLKKHLEAAGKMNLTEFFSDWFYGEGYPLYTIKWKQSNKRVEVEVKQGQSSSSVYFFDIPLPLRFKGTSGDTLVVVNPVYSGEKLGFDLAFDADSVFFDPDQWVLAQATVSREIVFAEEPKSDIAIFPNPFNKTLNISLPTPMVIDQVIITDMPGKTVRTFDFENNAPVPGLVLELGDLSNGSYLLTIVSGETRHLKKIVKY